MAQDDIVQKIVVEGADQAANAFALIERSATQALGGIAQLAQSLVGSLGSAGIAAGAVVGTFTAFVLGLEKLTEGAAASAAAIRGLAVISGSSVEDMSALVSAFSAAGVASDGLVTNLRRFAQTVSTEMPKVRDEMKSTGDTIASSELKAKEAVNALNKVRGEAITYNEKDIAVKKAQIAVSEAQRAADQASANDIRKFVQYFDDLAKGIKTSTSGMNLSLENLRKGLVGSLGGASDVLKVITVSLRQVGDPSIQQQILKLGDIFKSMPDGVQKTALAVQLFGRSAGPGLIAFLSQGSQAITEETNRLKNLGLVLTTTESGALKRFSIANYQLGDTLDRLKEKFAAAISPAFTAALEQANKFLEEHTDDIVHMGELTLNILTKLGEAWTAILPPIKLFGAAIDIASDAGAKIIDWGVRFTNWLTDNLVAGLRIAVEWVESLINAFLRLIGVRGQVSSAPAAAPDAGGMPMASGGLVWGKGGIDTNLAWLTSGEYVIRAAAVRAIGLRALDAINTGFAPRFASGGLNIGPRLATVSASAAGASQRTLHLTIEGRSFSGLSIPESTAQSLERFAVHSQIASAGRRPSWRR